MADSPNHLRRATWVDPVLGALLLLVLLGVQMQISLRHAAPPPQRITPQLRLLEWQVVEAEARAGKALTETVQGILRTHPSPYDALALAAWLRLRGAHAEAERLLAAIPAESPALQHRNWATDLRNPSPDLRPRLGQSLVGRWMDGADTPEGLARSMGRASRHFQILVAALCLGGLAFLGWLGFRRTPAPPPIPVFDLSGSAFAKLLLLWFLVLMGSGTLASLLLGLLPFLRPLTLPLAYLLHAGVALGGLGLLLEASPRALFQRLPFPLGWRLLPLGLGFAMATLLSLVLAGNLIAPWWPFRDAPQQGLLDLLARARGLELGAFFLTAVVLAPLFEEILFRGTLLPWLQQRFTSRLGPRIGTGVALALSAVLFGLTHLEPGGLPTLILLGACLGWAYLRSGSLWVPILIHAGWNGTLLFLNRSFLLP